MAIKEEEGNGQVRQIARSCNAGLWIAWCRVGVCGFGVHLSCLGSSTFTESSIAATRLECHNLTASMIHSCRKVERSRGEEQSLFVQSGSKTRQLPMKGDVWRVMVVVEMEGDRRRKGRIVFQKKKNQKNLPSSNSTS